jgi:hypothetical protein
LTNIAGVSTAEASQEPTARDTEHRVGPVGRDLQQRHQHKRPSMQFGMRQNEPSALASLYRVADAPAAIIEKVDVETARTPTAAKPPPGTLLNALDKSQERRRCQRSVC